MTIQKSRLFESVKKNIGQSRCDDCGSSDLTETGEGPVCRNCGLVLDELVMEYHRPYKEECVQHGTIRP